MLVEYAHQQSGTIIHKSVRPWSGCVLFSITTIFDWFLYMYSSCSKKCLYNPTIKPTTQPFISLIRPASVGGTVDMFNSPSLYDSVQRLHFMAGERHLLLQYTDLAASWSRVGTGWNSLEDHRGCWLLEKLQSSTSSLSCPPFLDTLYRLLCSVHLASVLARVAVKFEVFLLEPWSPILFNSSRQSLALCSPTPACSSVPFASSNKTGS